MLAAIVTITLIITPFAILFALWILALIAEYLENPVIELVEKYRKKYSNTNEN